MTQKDFLLNLCENNKEAIIVGSIGTISYDLGEIDHPEKHLIKGAMGAALGAGLGLAMNTDKKVIVVIGDGSFLMKMGSMSTILKADLPNLEVHVINNNSYRSCGGQTTNFKSIEQYVPFNVVNVTV
jgi:phosphonopyruvate decarboxylase